MQTHLPQRSVIRLTGPDADSLLQGIITNDIGLLQKQPVLFSAMLTAQGKFAHDFFIFKDGEDRLIDIDASHQEAFLKKLKLYKLRAKVAFEATALQVWAAWDAAPEGGNWHADPRLATMGWRRIAEESMEEKRREYEAHRLSLGVPDGAQDANDRHFLLELGYDQLNGVSFTKGCFVGQEPTARMHYRKVLRKGIFQVSGDAPLPEARAPIMAGEKTLGEMRSSQGNIGLAFCRMDPVQSAQTSGEPITAGEQLIHLNIPNYMQEKWTEISAANE